ncbi:hypothetical protein [Macromonas bipunctata]|uniref:hypothetical protein n=1 Tax=Macromonas bipunctata TaxID=183670 RepID=UPI001F0C0F2B|nr:hypothetical protein [Macromonas bipunctata]
MNTLLQELARLFQHYPKRFMGGLGVLLLGTGVTAFGVAPLSPTASTPRWWCKTSSSLCNLR